MNTRTVIGMLAAALAAATISACGTTTAPTSTGAVQTPSSVVPPSAAAHNAADVAFVHGMVPHHRQAVQMAGLAPGHSQNPQVLDLATQIGAAQDPEIQTMTGWLQQWGAGTAADAHMAGMSGTMTADQMQQLGQANGPGFDRLFLQMMIDHHGGAVTMAQTELRDGQSADAKALARTIVDAQQAEITTMRQLLTAS